MEYSITVIHTSSGASFSGHGSVRDNLRPSTVKLKIEASCESDAIKLAIKKAEELDPFYGRTLDTILHDKK